MFKIQSKLVWTICLLLLSNLSFGQARIQVRVLDVSVSNSCDMDNILFDLTGDSDFVWEYTATDNTLGFQNHDPVLLESFNYASYNNDNGPYTITAPNAAFDDNDGIFFDQVYVCIGDIPTQMSIDWEAYENDNAAAYAVLGIGKDGPTGNQFFNIAVPALGSSIITSASASASSSGCTQQYNITFEVTTLPLVGTYIEDNICDANQVIVGSGVNRFTWCPNSTIEPNEPNQGDVTNNRSGWVYFIAPPSGRVEVTTDFGGTDFGTYIEIYHAADGAGCLSGIQPITGALIKDKFEYLSWVDNADLGSNPFNNFLGNADISFDDCSGIIFSNPLVAGEAYYVQVTTDDANQRGYIDFAVNDLGGSPAEPQDIPCLSIDITGNAQSTTVQTNAAGSPVAANPGFGCATSRETGDVHTNNDPEEYFAYDYDHGAYNNGSVSESVWTQFTSPNSGRIQFEGAVETILSTSDAENVALFAYDSRFSPGIPSDYSCADLINIDAAEGGIGGLLGGNETAIMRQSCLEPGYQYYGMIDPEFTGNEVYVWAYDPSVEDPINNPPGNDILCLTMMDPLYEIIVTPAGLTPPFQAVAGNNERGCREYLAGEPPVIADPAKRADQTVWHFFTVPNSGAVEMNLRAYIGMDTLRYSVYELLNGTDCYGGLNPATYTNDGTQTSPIITPLMQGSAGFEGNQESVCCLTPGAILAIQLDGGSPGDEGQYIIEYIREVESYAGDTYVELEDGLIIDFNGTDTAFVCFNDTLIPGNLINGIGEPTLDIPSCLDPGFVIHSTLPIPDPVTGSGFAYIDTVQGLTGVFVNTTDGSGSFGNPLFNTVYYVSSMADETASWGDFTCNTSTVDNAVNIVYLEPIIPVSSYDNSLCEITFTSSGGLSTFYGTDFNYTIYDASMNLVETGSFAAGVNVVYSVTSADIYTISVDDGACPYTFTVDASTCGNPCVINPIIVFVNDSICQGQTIFLEGANQSTAGLYTDVFTALSGCDSTIYTTLTISNPVLFEQTVTICEGTSLVVGANSYSTSGVYTDILVAANTCDSIVTTNLFVETTVNSSLSQSICSGTSYLFGGTSYSVSGTYIDNLIATQGGCDSIVTLYLTVEPLVSTSTTQTVCAGNSLIFGSQTLSSSGTYTEMYTGIGGCDSLVTMYFVVTPTIENSVSATICQGQSYVLGTQNLIASGEYSESFVTTSGCDSLVRLFLTLTDQLQSSFNDTICLGETVVFGSQSLTQTGNYSELFPTTAGCDSLVTINLIVQDCEALLEISNICTPNDDGNNDTWKVSDITQIEGCTVQIFNRWGQLIFETVDYKNDWAGTRDSEPLPDGVYYYVISCDANREYQGVINLMRFKK